MKFPILMYHYVRPSEKRLSSRHNVLDYQLFLNQLEILRGNYQFVTSREIVQNHRNQKDVSSQVWLTFDDGYKDCIDYVVPGLLKFGARATFYIPTEAIFERKLLGVNKVHILLSGNRTPKQLVEICSRFFEEMRVGRSIDESFDDLFCRFGVENLWNDAETEFLKKIFLRILPIDLGAELLSRVFEEVVFRSESSWADDLYLTPQDLKTMDSLGMEIGSHGHSHNWLGDLDKTSQIEDLSKSFQLLESVIGRDDSRTMCYPFGSYNADTIEILSSLAVRTAVVNDGQRLASFDDSVKENLKLDRIDIMFFEEFLKGNFN